MKKLCLITLLIFCFSVVGCGNDTKSIKAPEKEISVAPETPSTTDVDETDETDKAEEGALSIENPIVVLTDDDNVKIAITEIYESPDGSSVIAKIAVQNKKDQSISVACSSAQVDDLLVESNFLINVKSKTTNSDLTTFIGVNLEEFKNVVPYFVLSDEATGEEIAEYSPLVFEAEGKDSISKYGDRDEVLLDDEVLTVTLCGDITENTETNLIASDNDSSASVSESVNSTSYNIPLIVQNKSKDDLLVSIGNLKKLDDEAKENTDDAFVTRPVSPYSNEFLKTKAIVTELDNNKIKLQIKVYKSSKDTGTIPLYEKIIEIKK